MKTASLVALQKLQQFARRLSERNLQPVLDGTAATLSFSSSCSAVERVFLRINPADDLLHIAIVTRLRCQPDSAHKEAALHLMRLSTASPLPGWLLDEKTGAILLRMVLLPFAAPLDFDLVWKTVAAGEALIRALEPQLARIAAGQSPELLNEGEHAVDPLTAHEVFRAFSE